MKKESIIIFSLIVCMMLFCGCEQRMEMAKDSEVNSNMQETTANDYEKDVNSQDNVSTEGLKKTENSSETPADVSGGDIMKKDLQDTKEKSSDMDIEKNSNDEKILSPGSDNDKDLGVVIAQNEPSEEAQEKNEMGIDGVSDEKLALAIKSYVGDIQVQEAPDGTKIWTGDNGSYSVDIQGDTNSEIFAACFMANGENAIPYLKACVEAINPREVQEIEDSGWNGTFVSNGMTFEVETRNTGYFMRVCSDRYIATLESPN